jgi:uncharacterized protein YbjT (DUF2867 family)
MTLRAETVVVGATGLLGMEIVRTLREAGTQVRAVVRSSADQSKRLLLQAMGADLVDADLKDSSSLEKACQGVASVVSTASATLSRQDGDSIATVDEAGQLSLISAAERAGAKHFVFISLPPSAIDFALMRIKRRVEARLREGSMSFSVLQPAHFMEVWLGPALGFDPLSGRARIYGDGTNGVSWISFRDVARFAAGASKGGPFAGRVIPLGGPDVMTPLEVVRLMEELGAPTIALEHIPEASLELQRTGAGNALEEAYAALMLTQAYGQCVDSRAALDLLPGTLRTLRDYASEFVKTQSKDATKRGDTHG